MEIRKKAIAIALVLTSAAPAFGQVGIGVSFNDEEDRQILIPYMLSENVFVEGNIGYSKSEIDYGDTKQEIDSSEFGIGAYYKKSSTEKINVYAGASINYVKFETESNTSSDMDGYEFLPTLGAEFEIVDNVFVAAEASWFFLDMDGTQTIGDEEVDSNNEQSGTDTRILIRYFF